MKFVDGASFANGFQRIQSAIRQAAERTGVDFDYLYKQAEVESGFNATARAKTSSATGLYQFLDQTWLSVVKRHGAKHGLGWAADCITQRPGGGLCVRDPQMRSAVLALRNQPEAASLMAAEHAADNRETLEASIGRPANRVDLYLCHFLGVGGAAKFLKNMAANPDQRADALLPAAAAANRPIFYEKSGVPRSLAQVYERFASKLDATDEPLPPARDERLGPMFADRGIPAVLLQLMAENGEVTEDSELAPTLPTLAEFKPGPQAARLAYMMLANLGA